MSTSSMFLSDVEDVDCSFIEEQVVILRELSFN